VDWKSAGFAMRSSKAAGLSLTRSIRAELGAQGTQVVGVLAVQTETEWERDECRSPA